MFNERYLGGRNTNEGMAAYDSRRQLLYGLQFAKHPVPWGSHPHRVNHYKPYESELNMAGIDYPVKIDQVKKFERQNPTISVSVFGYEENELFPLYVTKDKKELHVNLLLYSQDTRRHYCLIRDLDRLLSSITRHDGRMYHCNYCMHGFVGQDLLDDHEPHCGPKDQTARRGPYHTSIYRDGYDPEQHNNYLMYLDANNLYGWAMSQALPVNNFGWLTEQEATELQQDLMTLPDDGTEGYILEVDLSYPEELHDLHNDYPLAPERQKVTQDMLSPYCQQLNEELNLGGAPVAKLVPNLNDKQHYILHYRNLKQYLSLGMKLTKVHRVLGFDQSPWLKSYIDFNTEKRKHATNDFEKDFFKLMNNSVFGKTMENLRKREKPSLYLNRPIYVGFCILDLSKTLMYDFHYNVIKQKYGNNATLLFTDTDSLCYNIKTEDIYEDMYEDLDLYDTSEYPRDHVLHSTANKKVLGKMKDETHGLPIEELVGLRPKMYSLLYHEEGREVEKKTAKGVAKHVTKHRIRHTHYRDCLFEKKRTMANMTQIRSDKHQLFSVNMNKIGILRPVRRNGLDRFQNNPRGGTCAMARRGSFSGLHRTARGPELGWYRMAPMCYGAPVAQNCHFPTFARRVVKYYLSTRKQTIQLSTGPLRMSPLAVYQIPCNATSDDLTTGFGSCPSTITITFPILRRKVIKYVPWTPTDNNATIQLHYQSLGIPPLLKLNKTVLNALDITFHRLDGDLANKLQKVRTDIDRIHEVNNTPTAVILASIAICLSLINVIVFIVLCCYHRQRHTSNLDLVHYVRATPPQQAYPPHQDPHNEALHIIDNCPDCGIPPPHDSDNNDNEN
ncbi:hypothetical protein QZH41_017838 [Actinostola sp. cb2023]|nr:hypothetical protein QZH41_017838 [Actinostola sp. cb2023]